MKPILASFQLCTASRRYRPLPGRCLAASSDASAELNPSPDSSAEWRPGTTAIHAGALPTTDAATGRRLSPEFDLFILRVLPPIRAGERSARMKTSDALTTPIVQTSTYAFRDSAELIAFQVRMSSRQCIAGISPQ